MTRAEYQAKYGVAAPAPVAPVRMTRAQYDAKYSQPQAPAAPEPAPQNAIQKMAANITPKSVGSFALGAGKDLAGTAYGIAKDTMTKVPAPARALIPGANAIGDAAQAFVPQDKMQAADKMATEATTPANPTEQAGANTSEIAQLFLPFVGGALKTAGTGEKFAQSLEKLSLRLTPQQKRDLGDKVGQVTAFIRDNIPAGSAASRYEAADTMYQAKEKQLQEFLDKNNTARGVFVPRSVVLDGLESLKSKFRNSRDAQAAFKQIDDAKKLFEKGGTFTRQKIPVARFNELKRSTFDSAYNKAGTKVLDDVEHAIGDLFKTHVEDATKGLQLNGLPIDKFNKEYGTLINTRNLLKIAETRNEVGPIGRIISAFIGGGIGGAVGGGPVGAGVGALIGEHASSIVAGTAVRSGVSKASSAIGRAAESVSSKVPENVAAIIKTMTLSEIAKLRRKVSGGSDTSQ